MKKYFWLVLFTFNQICYNRHVLVHLGHPSAIKKIKKFKKNPARFMLRDFLPEWNNTFFNLLNSDPFL